MGDGGKRKDGMGMGCVWDKLTRVSSAGEGWGGGGSRSGLLPRLNARSLISSRGLMEHREGKHEGKNVFTGLMDELCLERSISVVQRRVLLSFSVCGKDEKKSELFFFELLLF